MTLGQRLQSRSFDTITRRAVARMTAGKDWPTTLRIMDKARNARADRAALAFLDRLVRPHDASLARGVRVLEAAE